MVSGVYAPILLSGMLRRVVGCARRYIKGGFENVRLRVYVPRRFEHCVAPAERST